MAELELLHVPPGVVADKLVEEPEHTVLLPTIEGTATTVTSLVVVQPVAAAVNVIVDVPEEAPVTAPIALLVPIVATDRVPLTHVPPTEFVRVVVVPTQVVAVPPIAAGSALTVTIAVFLQPVGSVYVIVDVPPATPVTKPDDEPMVATPALLLTHVPPASALLSNVVAVTQAFSVPVMAAGRALTVTVEVV
jgi:hypothetical protein